MRGARSKGGKNDARIFRLQRINIYLESGAAATFYFIVVKTDKAVESILLHLLMCC
jgi:hypothetical protein